MRTSSSNLKSSFLDGGWDNDNFLDSLSRGNSETDTGTRNEAIERANDEYWEQSRYGRPPPPPVESPSKPPPTKLNYAESLKQHQQQKQQQLQEQQQQIPQQDLTSVSDAAAEIYEFSYNKNVKVAPSATTVIDVDASSEELRQEENTKREEPLSKELLAKAKASHDDEAEERSQGGSRFQELMERAKEKAKEQPPPPPPPPPRSTQNPMDLQLQQMQQQVVQLQQEILRLQQQQLQPVPQEQIQQQLQKQQIQRQQQEQLQLQQEQIQKQQQELKHQQQTPPVRSTSSKNSVITPSMIMTPEEVATLSVEEQARLYREFFYVQQQKKKTPQHQQMSKGSTSENFLEAGIGFDGKKIGSNRDADAISNASDVYFAQLKRDSTTRNLARYSGDDDKANAVFHDPAIQDIHAPVNPYLEDQQKKMRDVLVTVPEEMLVFQEFEDEEGKLSKEELASYTGISYKEKMGQKKREREEKRKNKEQWWTNIGS